jgi:Tfp pilus assembly protein FimV
MAGMIRIAHYLLLHLLVFIYGGQAVAESKRVQVYQLSQQTWDVRPGDTLSGIAAALLPGAYRQQQALMQDIIEINPHAFIDSNPDLLRAYARLILPDELQTYSVPSEGSTTHVQQFSWGSIQRHEQ